MKTLNWSELENVLLNNRTFWVIDERFKNEKLFLSISNAQFFYLPANGAKSLYNTELVWNFLLENHATKTDLIIGVGGGSITDLTTFVAGTYKRGVRHGLIPTTILAATDAAIGGKGGIDFQNVKNAIGCIKEPEFLVVHPPFFHSLSNEETSFGWAEVVKHALIGATDLYQELSEHKFKNVEFLVSKSIEFKNSIVKEDLFETGIRKILNFGHTLGHALESYHLDTNQPFSHGKCVVLGMLKEILIMEKIGSIQNLEAVKITNWIKSLFPTINELDIDWKKVLPYLKNDKKNEGNLVGFVEFCGIGKVKTGMKVNLKTVQELLS